MEFNEENIKKSYSDALEKAKKSTKGVESGSKVVLQEVTKDSTDIVLDVSSADLNNCCSPDPTLSVDQNISFGCIRLNDLLETNVKAGNTVIDFGSGPGHDLFMAARLVGKEGRAIGVDFTDAMIKEASSVARKEGLTQVELVKASIDEIPLPDNIADFINEL